MKKLIATVVALGISGSAVFAGPYSSPKNPPMVPPPPTLEECTCFSGDVLEVSVFAAGMLPSDDSYLDDAIGGGLGLGYFFTENVGIEANYAAFAQDSEAHLFTANLVLRAPISGACFAPYFLVGGGVHTNSVTQGLWNVGGGIDWRLDEAGCWGIFADATYTWTEETDDYTVVRIGIRTNF